MTTKTIYGTLLACLSLNVIAQAAPLILTQDGAAQAEIVLDITAPQRQLEYAAQELTNWLSRITGGVLPVTATPGSLPAKIHLGTPEHSPAVAAFARQHADDFKKLQNSDGFIIAQEGNHIYLAASRTKGVLNAVYRFLERNSDIIFVRAAEAEEGAGTIYGHHPTLVNTVEKLVDIPALPKHRFWTAHSYSAIVWQARLLNSFTRQVDGNMSPQTHALMATTQEMGERVGNLWLGLIDPRKYLADHPDFFPLVRGQRISYHDCQLCFMNPEMIKAFCDEAALVIAANPRSVTSYILGHGDNSDLCECEAYCSKPISLPDGSVVRPEDPNFRSTQYALFNNAVWDNLTARFPYLKPYPMRAYLFTSTAPGVIPRGAKVEYCPYIKNHKKPVYDDEVNGLWHRRAESFSKAGITISDLYEYYLCHTTPQFYHAVCEVAQKDIRYYRDRGLEGMYLDAPSSDDVSSYGDRAFDISAIEFWVMSRLMWDPETDVREARREFCRRAYREAAEPMIAYYERLGEVYNSDPIGCYWNDDPVSASKHYVVDKGLTDFVRQQLDTALAAAQHLGSRRLIELHRNRMLGLIETAEKIPPRITLSVPATATAPLSDDPASPEWVKAAVIEGLTRISDASKSSHRAAQIRFMHDKRNLYLALKLEDPECYDNFKAGKYPPAPGKTDWNSLVGPTVELFMDGGLKNAGSYYQLAFAINGNQYTGRGSVRFENDPPQWQVTCTVEPGFWRALVTIPLDQIGMVISQGNKLGFMIVTNDGAWNGGQWHSPTGFQTLALDVE